MLFRSEDLRVVAMSATLDPGPVSQRLGGAPLVESAGRMFPVETRYLDNEPTGRIEDTVTAAIRRAIAEESLAPGASPTDVARRHGIGTGLLYTWRRTCLGEPEGPVGQGFARVNVEGPGLAASVQSPPPPQGGSPMTPIEIVLMDGTLLRIDPRLEIGRAHV